jgi:diguanylate cyclase (GGDEF)-like protein
MVRHLCAPLAGGLRVALSRLPSAWNTSRTSTLVADIVAGATGAALGGAAVYVADQKKTSAIREISRRTLDEEHRRFLAAAEGSIDAFYILDSVRDANGEVEDFLFRYLNAPAERRFKCGRSTVIGSSFRSRMEPTCEFTEEHFRRYREVVATGVPMSVEFRASVPGMDVSWLRHQVIKLGDGIAITSSDLSELKQVQERFQKLAEFSDRIFDNAPFSIFATDAAGTITAMNQEAEALTGYRGEELVNRESLLVLHDGEELEERAAQIFADRGIRLDAFDVIAECALNGDTDAAWSEPPDGAAEREWTFIRRDGTRVAVNLAVNVLRGADGGRTGLIGIASDVNARRRAAGIAAVPAVHDGLTGLIGQSLLEDRISQAIKRSKRTSTKVAVLTIDLDHFKRINDALGHRVGDEILTAAAARLLEKVRSADTVARVGGDEFIVVVSDQVKVSDIEFCAELFLRAISVPYNVQGHTINVTASVGICLYPDFAGDTEHMLRRSEAAMHAAKEAGRNRSVVFAPAMLDEASSRLSMEGALRQALNNNELFIEYQPQVELPSGKVIGMEALLRWRHPRFGLVSPSHFIPMAEKTGLLPEFGIWAMHRACREAKWIQDRLGRNVSLSVNLTPNQFEQKKLLKTVEEALAGSGLAAADLEIEIIENTLMINSTANLMTLASIRELGVKLSIDDFGTGFCNFNYLLQYQVDRLKIDQSFVRQAANDGNAASVVRTVIAMSHGLGVKVIAEGVETREQLKFLMRRRCDQAQGYFFARPLSPERFAESVSAIEAMVLAEPSGERVAAGTAEVPDGCVASAIGQEGALGVT